MSYSVDFYHDSRLMKHGFVTFECFHFSMKPMRRERGGHLSSVCFKKEATSHCPGRSHSSICFYKRKHILYQILCILKMPIFAVTESHKI